MFHGAMGRPLSLVSLLVPALLACEPEAEVGRCTDEDQATAVVFDSSGFPAYAGQALLQQSCGNGSFCHSAGIPAGQRLGAPAGLDFDMVGSRSAEGIDEDSVGRLRAGRNVTFEWRNQVLGSVKTGFMPPPDAGDDVLADLGYRFEDGTPLPRIDSAEGMEILRQWLACGPPVVGSTTAFPDNITPVGDVVPRGMPMEVPEPNFTSIYDVVLGPQCGVSCHGPGPASQIEESGLDLSDRDTAYMELVGVEAEGNLCAGSGELLVVANDPEASLLIDKMVNREPACGDPMPPVGPLLPDDLVEPIRQWIAMGAADD